MQMTELLQNFENIFNVTILTILILTLKWTKILLLTLILKSLLHFDIDICENTVKF